MSYKCDLDGVNFIKPNDWTFLNGFLKANLFHFDNLYLIKDENAKLSESIINVIKPDSKTSKSVSMSSKLFNDKDFPPFLRFLVVQVNLSVPVMIVQVNLFV